MTDPNATVLDLLGFIEASPTPYHCVQQVAERLEGHGFRALAEREPWELAPSTGYYVVRGGGLVAFRTGTQPAGQAGFRIIGAHTDSPDLRVKPLADVSSHDYAQLGVEVYGGALLYTWLDRDLGLAGRVVLRAEREDGARPATSDLVETRLLCVDRPILRVPSLAAHLDRDGRRDVRKDGLLLNEQKHLVPVLAVRKPKAAAGAERGGSSSGAEGERTDGPGLLRSFVGSQLGVDPERILSWDLSLMDVVPPTLGGLEDELVFSPRIDNQAMCHAALLALLRAAQAPDVPPTQIICLYDHEEVGSSSVAGAAGSFVEDALRRIAEIEGPGASPGGLARAAACSFQISADMAHAVHPNHVDRHEPQHLPHINRGPVIKINAQQRYATCAEGAGLFEALCRDADVPLQKVVCRTDMPCGSTIGPISAARLGIRTVDVGNPMLSMHSIREQAGAEDPERMVAVMSRFLRC